MQYRWQWLFPNFAQFPLENVDLVDALATNLLAHFTEVKSIEKNATKQTSESMTPSYCTSRREMRVGSRQHCRVRYDLHNLYNNRDWRTSADGSRKKKESHYCAVKTMAHTWSTVVNWNVAICYAVEIVRILTSASQSAVDVHLLGSTVEHVETI